MAGMAKPSPTHSGAPALVAIGYAVRAVRSELGLSQESLAHDSGLDRSYLGGIERGEHNLTLISLIRIADQLGIKPSEILEKSGL